MRQQRSNTIGVVGLGISVEHNQPNFFDEVLRGILQGGAKYDFDVTVVRHSQWAGADSLPVFSADRFDGLIVLGTAFRDRIFEGVDISGLPAVTVGGAVERSDLPSVDVDNYASARAAVQHLIDLGHGRIGYVSGAEIAGWARDRHRAYADTLGSAGIPVDESLIALVDVAGVDEGYDAACRLFSGDPSTRPTAVATVNDDTAHGVLSRLQEIGLYVPDDVSLIGFDDNLSSSTLTPPLSTIRQPKQAIGNKAVELLVTHILNPDAPTVHATIPGELVLRASTGSIKH
jgi:LacI family transcriptional regulator